MTDQYDNTNRGAIWKNDNKQSETHPDFKGSINIDGKDYWLSGWKRKEGAGPKSPALSLSVQAKEQPAKLESVEAKNDFEDDVPF
tara:strand:+ start:713 stop:967 length:255 start_codon:yes stop_codon:yes gene_type:complete